MMTRCTSTNFSDPFEYDNSALKWSEAIRVPMSSILLLIIMGVGK